MLNKFNCFNVLPVKTPYDPSIHPKKNKAPSVSQKKCAKITGSVMFLMNDKPIFDLILTLIDYFFTLFLCQI